MRLSFPFTCERTEVKRRILEGIQEISGFSMDSMSFESEWEATFAGQGFSGRIELTEETVEVDVQLSGALKLAGPLVRRTLSRKAEGL